MVYIKHKNPTSERICVTNLILPEVSLPFFSLFPGLLKKSETIWSNIILKIQHQKEVFIQHFSFLYIGAGIVPENSNLFCVYKLVPRDRVEDFSWRNILEIPILRVLDTQKRMSTSKIPINLLVKSLRSL